jgi:hypothetical protein
MSRSELIKQVEWNRNKCSDSLSDEIFMNLPLGLNRRLKSRVLLQGSPRRYSKKELIEIVKLAQDKTKEFKKNHGRITRGSILILGKLSDFKWLFKTPRSERVQKFGSLHEALNFISKMA